MSWRQRSQKIAVGDRVCYRAAFLRSTGQYTGDAPFARGVVQELTPLGDQLLARIAWDTSDLPERVNVVNLAKVTERGIAE